MYVGRVVSIFTSKVVGVMVGKLALGVLGPDIESMPICLKFSDKKRLPYVYSTPPRCVNGVGIVLHLLKSVRLK